MASISGAKPIALFSLQKTAKTAGAQSHSVDAARRFLRAFRRRRLSGKSTIGQISLCVLRDGRLARVFLMPSKAYLMPSSAQLARLEARPPSLRLCFRCAGFRRRRPPRAGAGLPHLTPTLSVPKGGEGEACSLPWNDHLLFGDEALDAADEKSAVGVERLGLRRGIGALHGGQIVIPGFGNSIDFDIRRRNVRPGPLTDNMRLNVTAQSRHGVSQRRVHFEPVLDEFLVRQPRLAGQQRDALDHRLSPSVAMLTSACCAGGA